MLVRSAWPGFAPRPRLSPSCFIPTSCRSTRPASTKDGPIFLWSSWTAAASISGLPRVRRALGRPPSSWKRWRAPWRWPTSAASSIATLNRPIFSWPSWAASRPWSGTGKSIRLLCPQIIGPGPPCPRLPISAWPSGSTTIPAIPRPARSSAPPVTCRPNRREGKTERSARPPTSIPSVRSSTSCSSAVRRSRRAIRSTPSVRSSSRILSRRASWSRASRMTWRRSA